MTMIHPRIVEARRAAIRARYESQIEQDAAHLRPFMAFAGATLFEFPGPRSDMMMHGVVRELWLASLEVEVACKKAMAKVEMASETTSG